MKIKKPYGKGLSGFMLGLLLATVIIAGIVFFINKSNETAFKTETPTKEELPKPEILTPNNEDTAASAGVSQEVAGAEQSSEPAVAPASEVPETAASEAAAKETSAVETPEPESKPEVKEPKPESKPKVVPVVPGKTKPEAKPAPETKKTEQKKEKAETKQPEKKEEPKKAAKPSPEQILESGSIEKAREKARSEAVKKETAQKPAASRQGDGEGGRTVLQMGSFNNRDSAEAHRAKLAMMGVSGSVVEAEVNGKRVYRVQSGKMSKEAAGRTQQTLKQNGVDSFARTVK